MFQRPEDSIMHLKMPKLLARKLSRFLGLRRGSGLESFPSVAILNDLKKIIAHQISHAYFCTRRILQTSQAPIPLLLNNPSQGLFCTSKLPTPLAPKVLYFIRAPEKAWKIKKPSNRFLII